MLLLLRSMQLGAGCWVAFGMWCLQVRANHSPSAEDRRGRRWALDTSGPHRRRHGHSNPSADGGVPTVFS
jgi:hypothetical protein